MRKYRKNKKSIKLIANRWIDSLFENAKHSTPTHAKNYIKLAREIGMKYKVRIKKNYKRMFCKHCNTIFRPGQNSRVRITNSKIVYYCDNCKKFTRIGIKNK